MTHVGAGEDLELEGDVFGDVACPGPVPQAGDEPATATQRAGMVLEGREKRDQRVVEARDLVRRELLEHAQVDEHPDDRLAGPVVGATKDPGLQDPQGRRRPARRRRFSRGVALRLVREAGAVWAT